MDEIQGMLRYVFETENRVTFPVSGTGSAGMEAAIVNAVEPGDDEIWVEWEWKDDMAGDLFEAAAQEGSFMLEAYEGAAGADGLIIEVHPVPELALSDGAQSLDPGEFASMMQDLGRIADAIGRRLAMPVGAPK